ncbi:MAG: dynamin family protein [Desulfococcaceae bacterium]
METSSSPFRDELLNQADTVAELIRRIRETPAGESGAADRWTETLADVRAQIADERLLRVAVVGAIKSGKSTFVNTLLGADHLRRGAGVITAMVTRIRQGEELRATLVFKSWEAVNADIHRAMALFPEGIGSEDRPFDIRREADREALAEALESLAPEKRVGRETLNLDGARLSAYLKGYSEVEEYVGEETARRTFAGEAFPEHREFAGSDARAVYLEDMVLEVPGEILSHRVEVADCQGSDSPNPMHLARIEDYLQRTHLIIYAISARTGIRQADIAFLSIIREMGILDNALFLLNVDISEHESADDLHRVADTVREELSLLRPDPPLYTFSALLNLFRRMGPEALSEKDKGRLAVWDAETELVALSDAETARFETEVRRKLRRERAVLLLGNPMERLGVLLGDMAHWSAVRRELLRRDADGGEALMGDLRRHQETLAGVRTLIRDTLDGAVGKIKKSLGIEINRFFDDHSGVTGRTLQYLRDYRVDPTRYSHTLDQGGFQKGLYQVFQEVRGGVDGYLAGTVNPEIIRFVRETEKKISAHFSAAGGPYEGMIRDAMVEYNGTLEALGIGSVSPRHAPPELPDMESLRDRAGLKIPPTTAPMTYTATMRAEAVARLGLYRGIRWVRKLFRRASGPEDEAQRALLDGVGRLKKETENSLRFTFKSFRENLKYQYIFKLVDAASDALLELLVERFSAFEGDLTHLSGLADRRDAEREEMADALDALAGECEAVRKRLEEIRAELRAGESEIEELQQKSP